MVDSKRRSKLTLGISTRAFKQAMHFSKPKTIGRQIWPPHLAAKGPATPLRGKAHNTVMKESKTILCQLSITDHHHHHIGIYSWQNATDYNDGGFIQWWGREGVRWVGANPWRLRYPMNPPRSATLNEASHGLAFWTVSFLKRFQCYNYAVQITHLVDFWEGWNHFRLTHTLIPDCRYLK